MQQQQVVVAQQQERPLVGWKQIGDHLGGVAPETARGWARRDRTMPISRTPGGAPVVYPGDLRAWFEARRRGRR
jgi:hypothetical protein